MIEYYKNHKKGIIGTAIFHIALLIVIIFLGFHIPLPLPGEERILVNFGYEDMGSGKVEPLKSSSEPVAEQKTTQITPNVPQESTTSGDAKDNLLTQDIEETVAVESKKTTKPKEKTPEEIEAERVKREELQKKIAEEKEILKKAEQERLLKEEEERKIQQINQLFGSSLGKKVDGEDSKGEGSNTYGGNQGSTSGSVDSNNHGKGQGQGSEGISYSLKGRTSKLLPKPIDTSQKEGIVVVDIKVNSNGDVISATPGVKGSNTLDDYLLLVAKEAAMKAKFDKKPNSPDQIGTITYHFVLE